MPRSNPNGPAVVVDPFSSGVFYAPAFKEADVPVVTVLSRQEVPAVYLPSFHPEDFQEVIQFTGDHEPVIRRLLQLQPRCILPGTEVGVELADQLAAQVTPDVANVPELTSARRHKWEMAQAAVKAGIPIIRQICTDDPAEVSAWIEREGLVGHDLVVKPPKSASTDGVTRVHRGHGWRAVFDAQLGKPNQWDVINDRMLVQEYVTGTEFVVDSFSYEGIHTFTDVCRYKKIDNGPHMAVYDSMEWIPVDEAEVPALLDYTRRVLDAIGMRFGAAHVEVMLTESGPRLIEVNARPHGGGQPRFCRVATGSSQIDRAVRYFARLGDIPLEYKLHQRLIVVFLINRNTGVVRNVEILDAVRNLPSHHFVSIQVSNGDRVQQTKDLLTTLALGFVVLVHKDREQIMADYEAVRRIERGLIVEPDEEVLALHTVS
jgi:biotin carboxylase